MKQHTTNYFNTFISVAEDCPATTGEAPLNKAGKPTIAAMQLEMIKSHPYQFTSDDVIFEVFATRNQIPEEDQSSARKIYFSKGQACLRTSPLTKRYGWGVHSNAEGKIAVYPVESAEYQKFAMDKRLNHTFAMRSRRK